MDRNDYLLFFPPSSELLNTFDCECVVNWVNKLKEYL